MTGPEDKTSPAPPALQVTVAPHLSDGALTTRRMMRDAWG